MPKSPLRTKRVYVANNRPLSTRRSLARGTMAAPRSQCSVREALTATTAIHEHRPVQVSDADILYELSKGQRSVIICDRNNNTNWAADRTASAGTEAAKPTGLRSAQIGLRVTFLRASSPRCAIFCSGSQFSFPRAVAGGEAVIFIGFLEHGRLSFWVLKP